MKSVKNNFALLDYIRLLCAFLVIGIHTRPFQSISNTVDNFFYYNISNYAVPFFYACTGFFIVFGEQGRPSNERIYARLRKAFKSYLLWTSLYLPLTIYGWYLSDNSIFFDITDFIRNLFFVGENYYSWTLWYLNGLIIALFMILVLTNKHSVKKTLLAGIILYVIGICITFAYDYSANLPFVIAFPAKAYYAIFKTTRNGLFQSFVFVSIGMWIGELYNKRQLILYKWQALCSIAVYIVKLPLTLGGGVRRIHKPVVGFSCFHVYI